MKVAVVFVLLFATVLCRPATKVSVSSSESSEEVDQPPADQPLSQKAAEVPQYRQEPAQAATEAAEEVTDPTSSPDSDSDNQDSEDSDDDDDTEESETEEDDTSESSESGESSTPAPATVEPVTVAGDQFTDEPILPTIVTDTARGDSLGAYPSDHKSIVYVEDKSYHKVPSPYKSYEYMGAGKKMAYDMTEGNELDKSVKVYKALQVHNDLLEEDTSTPEVESQGLDASQDLDISPRQASLPEEETTTGDAATSESSSATEEEENESAVSASTSQESEAESSQSNEETADSESDESAGSDSDEEGAGLDTATDPPAVLTAK
ncbi:osteopontin [Gasterosteus aculeatus]